MMKIKVLLPALLAGLVLGLAGCGEKEANAAKPDSLFKPTASLQEIMTSVIDPNADDVWNSVASISTATGIEDRQPRTDEEWATVRRHAITLLESSNLLLIEGRQVAVAGANTSSAPAELSAAEIQKTIEANRPDFNRHARDLHYAVQQTIIAIDAKNVDELVRSGGEIDKVCEACHKQFWYPNDKRPTAASSINAIPQKS